ncbi:hypothetical protein AB0P19_06905 [Microbacterium oleivorans]|uniref:hypothetical protein n=1 Tax=Microbacterium oleivorans TaxID=273677 RepID=UPI0033D51D06
MSSMKGIKFGDFDMQANGVTVTDTDVLSPPQNKIQADELAERDGALVVKQQYASKPFTVYGYLRASSATALDTLLDTFKAAMSVRNQPFDIEHAGSVRRYLASQQNIIISQSGPSVAGFSVQFLCPDGMGWDTEASALISSTNISQSAATIPFVVGGSYKADPYIKITVNTVSGGSNKTVSIGNASTLRTVSITRTWSNGDVVEMDRQKGELLVNGIPHDYRGALLSFDAGAAGITWNDEFTARDVTILANYTRRWL